MTALRHGRVNWGELRSSMRSAISHSSLRKMSMVGIFMMRELNGRGLVSAIRALTEVGGYQRSTLTIA